MRFASDTACTEMRTYRTDLHPEDVTRVATGFAARVSAAPKASVPGVLSLAIGRDEVIFVVSTGRVQIRVDVGTPKERRRHRAEALFVELSRAAQACGARDADPVFDLTGR